MKYEIQHWTLCDSWINTWTDYDCDGNEKPVQFSTHAHAQAALDAFLIDENREFEQGNIETPYIAEEFRIVAVTH